MLKTEKECIDYIHSLSKFGKKAGLCNIKALLAVTGNPQRELGCIHIAGTNGKGSVSCMLSEILKASGYKVGMNTSPYIEVFNERLTINGINIPSDKLVYYTNKLIGAMNELNINPIEFEFITAMGFLYFRDEGCDYAVIECGIGGLMDSTNVIENPALCVIAPVGCDHTEILGQTIEEIAFQKAGIIKENSKVAIHPDMDEKALKVIKKYAEDKKASVFETNKNFHILSYDRSHTLVEIDGLTADMKLLGDYQPSNAALAVNAARILGISDENIVKGIENARWKCRFEFVRDNLVIDGAHNFHGITAFAKSVNTYIPAENRVFVIGILNDKDFDSCAKVLSGLNGQFIVTDVPSIRQSSDGSVYRRIKEYIPTAIYEPDYKKATDTAIELAGDGYVCIAGSLYLAGAIRTYLS